MALGWPDTEESEQFEINEFIKHYQKLPNAKVFEIVDRVPPHKAGPDYVVRDTATGECFGVELTSVYLDNRSVPDVHMKDEQKMPQKPCDVEIYEYRGRLIQAIAGKIKKAAGYDKRFPLILSFYVNEYISIYMKKEELQYLIDINEGLFGEKCPFYDIFFWPLANGWVFSTRSYLDSKNANQV